MKVIGINVSLRKKATLELSESGARVNLHGRNKSNETRSPQMERKIPHRVLSD